MTFFAHSCQSDRLGFGTMAADDKDRVWASSACPRPWYCIGSPCICMRLTPDIRFEHVNACNSTPDVLISHGLDSVFWVQCSLRPTSSNAQRLCQINAVLIQNWAPLVGLHPQGLLLQRNAPTSPSHCLFRQPGVSRPRCDV